MLAQRPRPSHKGVVVRWIIPAVVRAGSGLVVVVVFVALGAVLVLGRPGTAGPADPETSALETEVAPAQASAERAVPGSPTVVPSRAAETASPTPAQEPLPTPAPPTPASTATPTVKPTVKPVVDPRPEGTPIISTARGSFGQTLVVDGVQLRIVRVTPDPSLLSLCRSDDPESPERSTLAAFELTMTWPDAGDASEPWVAVGRKPWHATGWDPQIASGRPSIVTTCVLPDETNPSVKIEWSPDGSPIRYLRWYVS
jgi:hypothetical protein